MTTNFKLLLGAAAAIIAVSPAYAGKGGTHVHTVHQRHDVNDVTHYRDVTRVHPVHEITDVERVVHHSKVENSTENVGPAPAAGSEHTVTRYHDVYPVDHQTRVHDVEGAPVIDHEITRIVNENVHHRHTDHQAVKEEEAARTIVRHRREDVDP